MSAVTTASTPIIDAYCTLGTRRETRLGRDDLLRQMDAAGIARAVIAPEDHELAVHNARGNQRILEEAAASGGRFIPSCTVNPWRGDEGIDLVRQAAGRGAKVLVLAPALQGFLPTDELVDPLVILAADLGIPVYVHSGPHGAGSPAQVVLLAQRHAQTRFILGHGGSTDHAYDMGPILSHHRPANVWFELSLVRPWAVPGWLSMCDTDRLIFGSSAPRNDPGFELKQFNTHVPMAEYPSVYGGTLLRLLEGDTPCA